MNKQIGKVRYKMTKTLVPKLILDTEAIELLNSFNEFDFVTLNECGVLAKKIYSLYQAQKEKS